MTRSFSDRARGYLTTGRLIVALLLSGTQVFFGAENLLRPGQASERCSDTALYRANRANPRIIPYRPSRGTEGRTADNAGLHKGADLGNRRLDR